MLPNNLILQTEKVLLRPIESADYDFFWELTKQDESMWDYFSLKLSDADQLTKWISEALQTKQSGIRMPFTIIEKAGNLIAGSSSFGNIFWQDKRLEIGWSWLAPQFRSTGINRHAKYAMMRYAFEDLGFERVEFKTGALNTRARKGLEKIGGIQEGILRSHSILWNGTRRDSVYYSVLKDEWPILKSTIFADIQ